MIATNYGNYGSYGYGPGPGSSPATSAQAMAAYQRYASQAYGLNFDQLSLSNGGAQNDYYRQLLQSQQQARRQLLGAGAQPPANWETMPLEEFLQWAARQRQQAGATRPSKPTTSQGTPSPLGVNAHAYTNSQGETVPVRSVRVNETGNYNSRQNYYNQAGYTNYNATYNQARQGRTYTITVEWADGRTQTRQVVNRGWPVDIW